ncbi:MAG: hydrolase [Gammaproteobacteria bacterium]|nr:hydrolase [Gammaproteobacteria bacterium]|tara:strand:+ start:2244 stop:3275 length:1032 start_codon:yes stop_codon:yes gene_type:complete
MNYKSENQIIKSPYKAPWWFQNAHLQTLYSILPWSKLSLPPIKREILNLPDGDITAVDWLDNAARTKDKAPILIILHGLEGSSESSYAQMLMKEAHKKEWRCCVLHFRDCGNCKNKLLRRYHAGDTDDIRYFIDSLKIKNELKKDDSPLFAVGYSLGGNVLLKYLGEYASKTPLDAAVSVCAPLNLHVSAESLSSFKSIIYETYLINKMKKSIIRKFEKNSIKFDWKRTMKAKTFAEFDDAITAPLNGYKDVQDYYNECSSINFLRDIRTATLIINALDDPFMKPHGLPNQNQLSKSITLEISENGGHIGFIDGGTPFKPTFYLPKRITNFLESISTNKSVNY